MKLKLLRQWFLLIIFSLYEVRKNNNLTEKLSFETTRGFLTSLLTLRRRKPNIWGFMNYFNFSKVLSISCHSRNVRPSPLYSGLNFKSISLNVSALYVLVYSCAANRYSEIVFDFSKI